MIDAQTLRKHLNTRYLIPATLIAICACIYYHLFAGYTDFIGDDFYYIVDNTMVHEFSLNSLFDIWTTQTKFEFFPVTIMSYAIDYALWGPVPRMFFLTNLAIFLLICLVAYWLSKRLNHDIKPANDSFLSIVPVLSLVFMMFHPSNVESVASISSRKELLYVLFGLVSFTFYIDSRDSRLAFFLSLLFLTLSQLSKGTAVVLPLIFLLYSTLYEGGNSYFKKTAAKLSPFIILSGLIFVYQFHVALRSNVVEKAAISAGGRIQGVITTMNFALTKFLMPLNLSYEYDIKWPGSLNPGFEWLMPLLLAMVIAYLIYHKKMKYLFLWLFVIIPFLPYSNIIPLRHVIPGNMVYYDHYLLFSCAAATPLLARGLSSLSFGWRSLACALLSVLICFNIYQDNRLAGYWKTSETLFSHLVKLSPKMARPYFFLGKAYLDKGEYNKAAELFAQVSRMNQPLPDDAYNSIGDAYAFSRRFSEAEQAYRKQLSIKPDNKKSLQNLSSTLIMLNRPDDARTVILHLLKLYPDDPAALANLSLLAKSNP